MLAGEAEGLELGIVGVTRSEYEVMGVVIYRCCIKLISSPIVLCLMGPVTLP